MHLFLLHVLVCFNFSETSFWPQYKYLTLIPNNGFRWYPLGKLSHMGLEQLFSTFYIILFMNCFYIVMVPTLKKIVVPNTIPSY